MGKLEARSFLREGTFALFCGVNDKKIPENKHVMTTVVTILGQLISSC